MRLQTTLLAATAVLLSACASTSTPPNEDGRDCFRAASVNRFGIVDDNHVRVSISPNRNYILGTTNNVNRLDWSQAIRLEGPSYICVGSPTGVYLMGGEPESAFIVNDIARDPSDTAPSGS